MLDKMIRDFLKIQRVFGQPSAVRRGDIAAGIAFEQVEHGIGRFSHAQLTP